MGRQRAHDWKSSEKILPDQEEGLDAQLYVALPALGVPSPLLIALALAATLGGSAVAAPGGQGKAGFRTSVPAMLVPGADAPAGVVIDPIISVGDELDDGFVFDSIPDGISLVRHGQGTVDLYVNHETSLVPFPRDADRLHELACRFPQAQPEIGGRA